MRKNHMIPYEPAGGIAAAALLSLSFPISFLSALASEIALRVLEVY